MHRLFGHPGASALYKFLEKADPSIASQDTKKAIIEHTFNCFMCQKHRRGPLKFKILYGCENCNLKSVAGLHFMYINGEPVHHDVDERPHFTEEL